mmetsp:Transcript_7131/g.22022  ORF Transcript_7131/g.22022 Transcript_7131/m.22022 type:complete len:87 (-) Transcript_7131:1359-1619(-)|eukprot:scaffold260996_cov33-Tisochrysis_lutea.AAC.2
MWRARIWAGRSVDVSVGVAVAAVVAQPQARTLGAIQRVRAALHRMRRNAHPPCTACGLDVPVHEQQLADITTFAKIGRGASEPIAG